MEKDVAGGHVFMRKEEVLAALSEARDKSKTRKFQQSVDLTINFKGIDFKKAENRIDLEVKMPHGLIKKTSSIAFVKDKEFAVKLKEIVSRVVMDYEIEVLSKKEIQEIAESFDVLMAEGPVMLLVGKFLGQTLAPRGKMPKPITQDLKSIYSLIETSSGKTKLSNKKGKFMPLIHVSVGKEIMQDIDLAENILSIYNIIEEKLPSRNQNIKSVIVKLSMGPPIKIGESTGKKEAKK
ncbi:MAG: 50S ribosomal protein L1 [archaeon]